MSIFPAAVTALAMLLYAVTIWMVGVARRRYHVAPPTTTGHPDFERYFRVQMNTMEQLVLFLPSLWLFSAAVSPIWAALLGVVWLIGRVLYMRGYYKATEKRVAGFIIGIAISSILLLGAFAGMIYAVISQ